MQKVMSRVRKMNSGKVVSTMSPTTWPTGSRAGRFGVPIAGKTGTAQNSHGDDHALFAGYAPADNPRFAAVAVVENGKHGSSVAAPLVGQLLAYLLTH